MIRPLLQPHGCIVLNWNEEEKQANRVIVKLLLEQPGIDLDAQDTAAGTTALMYAVITGDLELTQYFVEAGSNVNILDMQGNTALHWSVMLSEGDATIVHYLLKNGALLLRNNAGNTPLDVSPNFYIGELLQGKYTSFTHPLEVNFIDASLCPVLGRCSIGMTMCPGRQNHRNWSRDLDSDIAVLKRYNTELVVTLMRPDELDRMKLTHLIATIREAGMEIIHFPITDKWLPNSVDEFCAVVGKMVRQIKLGKRMVVHCNGGKGRTGLLVVGCLIQLGLTQTEATDLIRKVRPGMLRNPAQQVYLMWVEAKLRQETEKIANNLTESPKSTWSDFFSGLAGRYFSSNSTEDPTQKEPLLSTPSPRKSQTIPSPRRSQKTPSPRKSQTIPSPRKSQTIPLPRKSQTTPMITGPQLSAPPQQELQKTLEPPQLSQESQLPPQQPQTIELLLPKESPLSQESQLPPQQPQTIEPLLPKESPLSQESQLPSQQPQTIEPLLQLDDSKDPFLPHAEEKRHCDL